MPFQPPIDLLARLPFPAASADRDHVIDFWRGVSALMVVVHHLFDRPYLPLYAVTERIAPLGVQFFFVISGYIITSLLLKEDRTTHTASIKNFYIRRVFRIFPALLGYMVFLALLNILHWTETPDIPLAIFVCSVRTSCTWNIGHTWSLGIEEMFYAFWPLLFLVLARYRILFLTTLLAVCTILMSFGVLVFQGGHSDIPFSFACIAIGALYATSLRFRNFIQTHGFLTACAALLLAVGVRSHLLLHDITPFLILVIIITTYRLTWLTRQRHSRCLPMWVFFPTAFISTSRSLQNPFIRCLHPFNFGR